MRQASQTHSSYRAQSLRTALDDVLREGARPPLEAAVEDEVAAYIRVHAHLREEYGHGLGNGHSPERSIRTGLGDISA